MPWAKSGTRRVTLFAIASLFAVSLICLPQEWVSGASVRKPRRPFKQKSENEERTLSHYKIEFALDIDARSFSGVETIHWINTDDHPANMVLLHLYSNLRSPIPVPSTQPDANSTPASSFRSLITARRKQGQKACYSSGTFFVKLNASSRYGS